MKAQIRKQNPFRIESANFLYEKKASDSAVYEYGIDTKGRIYFAYLNGIVQRFTRKEFIKLSRSH